MMKSPEDAALRVAIVGAGPSGLYAAVDLLRRDPLATVELFDRQPCFGGLVRYGVSPDHAERRKVSAFYARLALASGDRKSVGEGRRVTVSVDIGGCSTTKKNKRKLNEVKIQKKISQS